MSGETGLIRVKQDGSRWAAVESWWRCTGMHRTEGMVFPCNHVMHREAGHPLIDCNQCYDKEREWEPVAMLPMAELEALRANEIDWERFNALDSEVVRLRELKARMDSVGVLPKRHGSPEHQMDIKGCSYCEGWDDGIDAYRNALEGGTR